MKSFSLSSLAVFGLLAVSDAFPSIARHVAEAEAERSASLLTRLKKRVAFNAAQQYVSTTGQHKFVPPGSGDARGPCPGLNALANHNYLPHNGVATIDQFINATTEIFGMGADLAAFLSVYGAIFTGNGLEWSIGGPTPNVPGLSGLLGTPQGISGSHNKYESDASPTRGDLYEYGNDYLVQMSQFQQLYDLGKANNDYSLQLLTDFRATRFQQSISNNPNFFYGPFTGVLVTPAAYTFIYRFMSNKSEAYPEGKLDGEVLKSFFAITGNDGNFKYNPGYEKIPDNWYTRNAADPYTIPYLEADALDAGLQHPEFLIPGGNTGTNNSYLGVNPSDLSGGVINAGNLLTGDNAFCLAYQATVESLPDMLSGLVSSVAADVAKLTASFNSAFGSLSCPKITNIDESQFSKYPGYVKSE